MTEQATLYPLEIVIAATPMSLGASSASRERWKALIREAARERVRDTDELGFLDNRPLSLTILYFPSGPMVGDVDNIVKPVMDALKLVAYPDDKVIERVLVQKFDPGQDWSFHRPGDGLAAALATDPPAVYIRVDDDLSWRKNQ